MTIANTDYYALSSILSIVWTYYLLFSVLRTVRKYVDLSVEMREHIIFLIFYLYNLWYCQEELIVLVSWIDSFDDPDDFLIISSVQWKKFCACVCLFFQISKQSTVPN